MNHTIQTIAPKKLVGMKLRMSLIDNKTVELWRGFMPRRKEISNALNTDLISMQVYDPALDFKDFTPKTPFTKWATVEVSNWDTVPTGMETFELEGGLYAVFGHKGGPANGAASFQYIFEDWLPQSAYELDNRPHFEVLGERYKNNDPDSEEEIWIPIRPRT